MAQELQSFGNNTMTLELGAFLVRWWEARITTFVLVFAFVIVGLIIAFTLPERYKSEALLAPRQSQNSDGFGGVAAQYGALLSSVGFSMGVDGVKKTDLGLKVLQSRKFIGEFIDSREILPELMALEQWDPATGKLQFDEKLFHSIERQWAENAKPTAHDAYEEFMDKLNVSEDKVSGFIKIEIVHKSPVIARDWTRWIVADLNAAIMRQDVSEATHAIDYLKEQASSTPLAELRNVFFRLIEDQTKTVMLARAKSEYLFETIDPAYVPQERHSPQRILIVVGAFVLGLIMSILAILFDGIRSSSVSRD